MRCTGGGRVRRAAALAVWLLALLCLCGLILQGIPFPDPSSTPRRTHPGP